MNNFALTLFSGLFVVWMLFLWFLSLYSVVRGMGHYVRKSSYVWTEEDSFWFAVHVSITAAFTIAVSGT